MDVIEVKGLKVSACHGVLESEKLTPQLFVFDIKMYLDGESAAAKDDLSYTANYARACALVSDYCKGNSFNLIEKLAHGASRLIVESFPVLTAAEVTVHKPQAPVGLPVADVAFTARTERNKVILSLGSSEGDREQTLQNAIDALSATEGLALIKKSPVVYSRPYGGVAQNEFANCAASFYCTLSPRALLNTIHAVEKRFLRKREVRWADRTLDIDVIFFGSKVIAEEGLSVPHPDYRNRPFVTQPVKEIEPDFVCPRTGVRMSDL